MLVISPGLLWPNNSITPFGQDNWSLVKCKPWYKVHSYEWGPVVYEIQCSVDGKDRTFRISEEGRILSGN